MPVSIGNFIPNIGDFTSGFLAFAQANMVYCAVFIVIGAFLGWALGSLFNGYGDVERRQLGQNYGMGYRRGFNEGRQSGYKQGVLDTVNDKDKAFAHFKRY